jgi:SAM-dependent methyltransferase
VSGQQSHEQAGHDCPVCGRRVEAAFVEIENVAVQVNVLHRTPDGARTASRGDLRLGLCDCCAFIWNLAFDPALVEYDGDYENSLHHSPAFEAYAEALAERLVERYDLRGKHVVELGCGQADFLRRLCALGGNRGTGFDPSYVGPEQDGPVTVHRALYSERTVGEAPGDFISCRHVLEHLERPLDFMRSLRRTLDGNPGAVVYFEVPNGEYQLERGVVWDLIYAHHSTFTAPSLQALFERGGFEVLDIGTDFGEQYLWIEARPSQTRSGAERGEDVQRVLAAAGRFAAGYHDSVGAWRRRIDGFAADGLRVVLWGAGAKGVSLLNALDRDAGVGGAVDLNPRKQGSYLPGSATPVVSPDALPEYEPDVVVLANPIYGDEVRAILRRLGQHPEIVCA